MRLNSCLFAMAATLAAGVTPRAFSQRSEVVYVVTYIEALPSAATQTLDLLTAYADESRGADGNLQFQALQRIGRPSHFAMLEAWADVAAHEAQSRSSNAERFRASLAPLLYSPPDERIHRGIATRAPHEPQPNAVFVLTHVDVSPASTDQVVEYLRVLAETSREEAGNLRFDVLVTERRNHMTIVEAWQSAAAQEAHLGAPHNRAFRMNLAPVLGALYDERLYHGL